MRVKADEEAEVGRRCLAKLTNVEERAVGWHRLGEAIVRRGSVEGDLGLKLAGRRSRKGGGSKSSHCGGDGGELHGDGLR